MLWKVLGSTYSSTWTDRSTQNILSGQLAKREGAHGKKSILKSVLQHTLFLHLCTICICIILKIDGYSMVFFFFKASSAKDSYFTMMSILMLLLGGAIPT